LTERAVDQLASVVHLRRVRRSSAERIVASSYSTTGSRLVDWLHASRSELSVSGYWSGVVRCFSTRQATTRISTASGSTGA
jgi:hypothetical protein